MRRTKFQKALLRGPEFACSSCHRLLYRKSVTCVTDKLREKIKRASEEKIQKACGNQSKAGVKTISERFKDQDSRNTETQNSNNPELRNNTETQNSNNPVFRNNTETQNLNNAEQPPLTEARKSKLKKRSKLTLSFEANAFKAWNHHMIHSVDNVAYICSTCKGSLQKGNIPAMAVANGLQLNHPDRPILTELENNLIARTINFQKMVLLPKSRMAAVKGRMISIPIGPSDIMSTAKQLPRLPSEAGIIPIKLKRKKEYKSHEKSEWVRPEQIFLALRYLAKAKNPYYQFYDDEKTYKARCRIKDQRGLRLLEDDKDNIEEDLGKPEVPGEVEVEDQAVRDSDDEGEDEMEIAMEKEEEDIENDPVRRQHFNYNEYSTLEWPP